MKHILVLLALFLAVLPAKAQWTVSTPILGPEGIEDALVLGADGSLYVSTYDGTTVKRISPDGTVSDYANGFQSPNGLAITADGTLYVTNAGSNRISQVLSDGTIDHQFVTGLTNPAGVAIDPTGTWLYIAQYQASRITRVRLDDVSTREVVASGFPLNGPVGMDFDQEGRLLAGNYNNGAIVRINAGNDMEVIATVPSYMGFFTVVASDIYATSFSANRIYHIDPAGTVDVIAGNGVAGNQDGPGDSARFNGPNGIVASVTGDTLYVSDYRTESLRMLVRNASSTSSTPLPDLNPVRIDVWPNPSSGRTTVALRGFQPSGQAQVDVLNIQGRKVRSLPVSEREVYWDGTSSNGLRLPSGLYFVRLTDGATHQVTPLILIH